MPAPLSRLPCGIIYTDAFCEWLARLHQDEAPAHPHRVLTLDYVRCASGPQRGRAWWQVHWMPEEATSVHRVFRLGSTRVHFSKSTQLGLRERCLDYRDGRVAVLP